jgi:hypothetical protein
VNWYHNIFSHVPTTNVREIGAMLKAIYASEDVVAAREAFRCICRAARGWHWTAASGDLYNIHLNTFDTAGTGARASTINGALVGPLVKPYTSW